MKKWILIALIASAGSVFSGTIATPHVAGDMQGWNASADPMTETSLGSDIWTKTFTNLPASTRYEFKITDGTWDTAFPAVNSWLYTDGSGDVTITYDGNSYSDGWLAATDRIGVSVDPGTWTAAGDFQSELGGSDDWNNADTNTAMASLGGGIYALTISNLTAGTYYWKAVNTGSWDAISIDARSIDAGNTPFTITETDLYVTLSVDAITGVVKTEVVPDLPETPTNVTANAISSSQITVSWDAVPGATGYSVKRGGTPVGATSSTNYTDTGLDPSTSYSYTVIATNSAGDSAESASANATTWDPPVAPAAPSNLVATAVSPKQINLTWDTVAGATGYIVKRDSVQVGTSSTASYNDAGLEPVTIYSYTVAATNEAGASADSASAEAETLYGIVMDGVLESGPYNLLMTQTVNTAWGDNINELNAAYTSVTNGRLYLMLTGNIEDNWNKLEIFLDTTDAVQTNVLDAVNNDSGDRLDGLTFDVGFEPDYHLHFRRGSSVSGAEAYIDIADLGAGTSSGYGSLFAGEGSAITGTDGAANNYVLEVAYSDANTGGVTNGTAAAADQHWTNSLYGLELSIDLRDLGDPTGTIKLVAMINNIDRNYLSNQVLGGLPAGSDSLGATSNVNFSAIAGDQFFSADVGGIPQSGPFSIGTISAVSGGTVVELGLIDLTVGASYKIQGALSLTNEFSDVAGTGFTAVSTNETVAINATNSVQYFKAVSP